VKISDCRVLTETAEDEERICKGKSVGEQWSSLCVVVIVIVISIIIIIIISFLSLMSLF